MRRMFRLVCIVGLLAMSLAAKDKQAASEESSNLRFTVVKDDNNKPVRNASVILHPVNKDGSQSKGGFQLKTDNDGNTGTEGIPYGKIRVQVLAHGFQTFGDDYVVDKPDMDIKIRLKRPGEQMSAYDKKSDGQPTQAAPPADAAPPRAPKPN